jgi:hypothetical protein
MKNRKLGVFLLALAALVATHGCSKSEQSSSGLVTLPTINSFVASATTVPSGGTTTLSWSVQNAEQLIIYPDNRDVTAMTSLPVSVVATTTYTLKALNAKGEATANTVVTATTIAPESPQLVYTDPPAGGKIRLVRDAQRSTSSALALKLVANADLTGYFVGFNLPVASGKVQLGSPAISAERDALDPGQSPQALGAVIPTNGLLANVLVTGMSQKAAGAGAAPNDARILSGQIFYTIWLRPSGNAAPGVVFSGNALGHRFRAALRDRLGNEIASQSDFAIGTLAIQVP